MKSILLYKYIIIISIHFHQQAYSRRTGKSVRRRSKLPADAPSKSPSKNCINFCICVTISLSSSDNSGTNARNKDLLMGMTLLNGPNMSRKTCPSGLKKKRSASRVVFSSCSVLVVIADVVVGSSSSLNQPSPTSVSRSDVSTAWEPLTSPAFPTILHHVLHLPWMHFHLHHHGRLWIFPMLVIIGNFCQFSG